MRLVGFVPSVLVLSSLACSHRTEVILGVATDLRAPGQIDTVQLIATRNGVPVVTQTWMLGNAALGLSDLPGSFGLYSPDGTATQIVVDVQGFVSGNRTPVVDRQSIFSLVPNLTLFERLTLTSVCDSVGGPTCAAGESCAEGVCVKQEVDAHRFPAFLPALVTHLQCAGVNYIDAVSGTPMATMPGGCASTDFCQEATCYRNLPTDDMLPPPVDFSIAALPDLALPPLDLAP